MLTAVVEWLSGKHQFKNLESLTQRIGTFAARSERESKSCQLVLYRSPAQTQVQPTSTDLIDCGRHLRQKGRVPKWIAPH